MKILVLNAKYNKFTITEEIELTDCGTNIKHTTWKGSFEVKTKLKDKDMFLLFRAYKQNILYFGKIRIVGCVIKANNKKMFNYEFIGNGQLYKESY